MTIFAPSDVTSVLVPAERGGCGQSHEAGDVAAGERFAVTCPSCEPVIAAMRTGWAATPAGVHLTPDEIGEAQAAEAAATRAQNRTWGDPSALGNAIRAAMGPAAGPSLLEQIAALSPDERAALAAMLTGDPAAGDQSVDTTPPARKPGRPRASATPTPVEEPVTPVVL